MELVPQPLSNLLRRVKRELPTGAVFDLPTSKMWTGPKGAVDLSRRFHGERAATGVGPAAGPHTQLAQNIALSYLAGARIQELKTVQIMDELEIPRPCIDATNIGFNVEWSQELKIEQSTEEYPKAALLLAALKRLGVPEGLDVAAHGDLLLDLSVGYDLKGIQTERVTGFIRSMLDASANLDRLRSTLAPDVAEFRDLEVDPALVSCITLSTFHGCPANEIELIARYLLEEMGMHVVVKLNPTLLGFEAVGEVLTELGYDELALDRKSFEDDLQWPQAIEMIDRLRRVAKARGRRFGVKLTNTLVVNNHKDFFPASEKQMYMSGQPLHVISMALYAKLRRALPLIGDGDTAPMMYTFSAGIDQHNFPLATSADLCPITTCTDLLRPGGYGRLPKYLDKLEAAMQQRGAADVDAFVLAAHGHAARAAEAIEPVVAGQLKARGEAVPEDLGARLAAAATRVRDGERAQDALTESGLDAQVVLPLWVHETGTRNAQTVAGLAREDPRYAKAKNSKTPKKIGSHLALFDCVSCDKCVPVCPNDANFVYEVEALTAPAPVWTLRPGGVDAAEGDKIDIEQSHQLATFVDFCNACGNCDVFCPEDGGPYNMKPHWFGSQASFDAETRLDGFYLESPRALVGRIEGRPVRLELGEADGEVIFSDGVTRLRARLTPEGPELLEHHLEAGHERHEVRSGQLFVLRALLEGVLRTPNPVSAGAA